VRQVETRQNERATTVSDGLRRLSYPLIDVSGTPYERGVQHGRAAGELIARYPAVLRQVMKVEARWRAPGLEPAKMTDSELEARTVQFLPFFERFAPEQVEEIRGVAHGAEVPFWLALLANVRAEIGIFDRLAVGDGCTAFGAGRGATVDGSTLIGQNQDQNALMRELTIILRVEPDRGPRMLMATFGGVLGYVGINSAGVGFVHNALANSVWRMGLPHYPLKRAILQQESIEGVLRQFDRAPLGSCANYVVSDRDHVVDIEATPDRCAVLSASNGWIGHGNNFQDSVLREDEQLTRVLPDSPARTDRIDYLIASDAGRITLDEAKRWLKDHEGFPTSICRHATSDDPTEMHSMYSMICEVERGLLHITYGNPCQNDYTTFSLN
jgi:isopenicillin-N N-acyltransferase-like protein